MPRKVPPSLTALGRMPLPEKIEIDGRTYCRKRTFKNDFFAVTALYVGEHRRVLVKIGRQAPFLLMPLSWIGRWLAFRETAFFRRLEGVHGIPRFIQRWGPTGIVREFVEGHPLAKGEHVPDDFHRRLGAMIDQIHERRMAYVDLEKCENVLVGDDGRPYLFDFQISWYWDPRWGGEWWPLRRLRTWFQRGDRYHLMKLRRRTRPDQMSAEELAASYRKPWYVRLHGALVWPALWLRRRILRCIDPRRKKGERGRIHDDEAMGVI